MSTKPVKDTKDSYTVGRFSDHLLSGTNNNHKTHSIDTLQTFRLLSYNIQVGINTKRYSHYLTRSWQHILPHKNRLRNLDLIANILPDFDIVALQEVDGGSIRSNYINQVEYLARKGNFPYWYQQVNRNLGKFAQHCNGLLCRFKPITIESHRLPGIIPGRGVIVTKFPIGSDSLLVLTMHLALSKRIRNMQLEYINNLIHDSKFFILMGDMNTHAEQLLYDSPLKDIPLVTTPIPQHTFPSWRPTRALDHILISRSLVISQIKVLNIPLSDHLPVAMEVGFH